MKKLDMKSLLNNIKEYHKDRVKVLTHFVVNHEVPAPVMTVMTIDPTIASQSYIKSKKKYFDELGVPFDVMTVDGTTMDTNSVMKLIDTLKNGEEVSEEFFNVTCEPAGKYETKNIAGMILQLPVPDKFDSQSIISSIPAEWDVDGLTPSATLGMHYPDYNGFFNEPCTPKGIMIIIDHYLHPDKSISELLTDDHKNMLDGKKVTVVGRGNLVGKPIVNMLINAGATVTCCNSRTVLHDLSRATQSADIVILATGRIGFFGSLYCSSVKEQLFIDCGVGRNKEGKLAGDFVPNEQWYDNVTYTPVPGGVGPMTVSMLMENFLNTVCHKYEGSPE